MSRKTHARPVDTDVKVPAAVRAAAALASEIHKQEYSGPEDGAAEGEGMEGGVPDSTAPAEAGTQPQGTVPAQDATPPQSQPATDDYRHKFESMKGRYDRETQINRGLNERIANLEQTIASLTSAQTTPAKAKTVNITDEEIAEYGPEFLDLVARQAEIVADKQSAELRAQVAELQKQLGSVGKYVEKDARGRMLERLDQELPEWRELNESEKFLSWLALHDPLSGVNRQELLNSASAANDAPRVLNFFRGFLASEAASAPSTPGAAPTKANNGAGKVPLESLAAPGRAKTAAPQQVPAEKPVISRADVTAFYADKARGAYRGRDEEAARLEAMIFEANRDGRIQ